ncbi:MAG: carboxypeptidase regulatory-like domain-containing protein [Acidobacteriaceae bacterium]
MTRNRIMKFLLLPLFLLLTSVQVFAQANSTIIGTVTDQTGAVVPGANVQLIDPVTGLTQNTVSDGSGMYSFAGLNAGHYTVKVSAKGFRTSVQTGVVVNISMTFRVNVKLAVGESNQTVTVVANALAVQAESNEVSTLITQQQIAQLPTNGRSIISLATFGMGISGNLPSMESPMSVNANWAISFNGLNQNHNIWILDGGEDYDRGAGGTMDIMPSQDALGEFQVLSSNYNPDYGYASGGAVTMSIKSGTSTFHGGVWEYDRNDTLDARDYYNKAPQPISELRYNVFGANLGGPFFIPGHYNSVAKNKTFFFYNEEWRRMVTGVPTNPIQTLPASDMVTSPSTFTYQLPVYDAAPQLMVPNAPVGTPLYNSLVADGLTPGQPWVYNGVANAIPANLLDSNALLFNTLHNLPPSTSPSGTYTPVGGHLPIMVREDLFRVDHNFNSKWSIFGHFVHDASVSSQATPEWQADNIPTVGSTFSNPSYSSVIKLTGTLSPNVLLEAALNYDGNKILIAPVAEAGGSFVQPTGWNAQSYFGSGGNALDRLPNITWSTVGDTWGPGNDPWHNGAEDLNEYLFLTVTTGKHTLKFGGYFNRYTKNQIIGSQTEGTYTFNDGFANGASTTSLTGDSYADFLLGLATSYNQANADPVNHYFENTISVFGMDNWHVTPRLNVQLGLRYDAMPLDEERNNQVSNFYPNLYQPSMTPTFGTSGAFCTGAGNGCTSTSLGLTQWDLATQQPIVSGSQPVNVDYPLFYLNGVGLAGRNGVPRGLARNDYNTIEPRLGFAYDIFGNGKTILRSGFGVFYERVQGNTIYDAAGAAPFVTTPSAGDVEFSNPSTSWLTGATAATPLFPEGYNSMDRHFPNPGVAEYSLGIQHQILPAVIFTVQYVGNVQWDQNSWIPINDFPLTTSLATRKLAAVGLLPPQQFNSDVTYPGFGDINSQENPANGSYNSLQVGLRQQNRWGLSYGAYYTWSHEIDDLETSNDLTTSYNPWNLRYDKGSGSLDRRQILNINFEYQLPFFEHGHSLTHSLAGGWEIAGDFLGETGLPWFGNAAPGNSYGDTVGLGGYYNSRPQLTGPIHYIKSHYQWLTNANFTSPVPVWEGGITNGFGNSGKDAVVGAGSSNVNLSVYKTFLIGKVNVQLRVDTFNTLNHPQFTGFLSSNPNQPSSGNFGVLGSDTIGGSVTSNARQIELGGKVFF